MHSRTRLWLLTLVMAAFSVPLAAQVLTGSITGSAVDSSGLPVAGAQVSLTETGTGTQRRTTTNERGDFVIIGLTRGSYLAEIGMKGFKTYQRSNVLLTAGERLSIGEIPLQVGDVEEKVTVVGEAETVQTASAERSAVLTPSQLDNTLMKGRSFTQLAHMFPGVVDLNNNAADTITDPNVSVLGSRTTATAFTVDGVKITEPGSERFLNLAVSMDSIAEVKMLFGNYQAEYGRGGGAIIETTIKSGAKQFHGMGSLYLRNEAFNANDFFSNTNSIRRPRYRYQTWSGNIGGPIYIPGKFNRERNKLFFFWNEEYWPMRTAYGVTSVTVPTTLERAGDFSQSSYTLKDPTNNLPFPDRKIPANRMDPNGRALLNFFPAPNFFDLATSKGQYNYQQQPSRNWPKRMDTVKGDYHPINNGVLSVTYAGHKMHWDEMLLGANGKPYYTIPHNWATITRGNFFTAHYVHTFSPTLLDELTIGHSRHHGFLTYLPDELPPYTRPVAGFNAGQINDSPNQLKLLPNISFGGIPGGAGFSFPNNFPVNNNRRILDVSNNITKIIGDHTLKAGIYLERWWVGDAEYANDFNGTFDFSSTTNNPLDTGNAYANVLTGTFNTYREANRRVRPKILAATVQWFLQDNWKVSRKLTLDYGLRFVWLPPYTQAWDQMAAFVPSLFNSAKAVKLIQPAIVGGKRVGLDPVTGIAYPATTIGALAPNSGDPINGIVLTAANNSYPRSLKDGNGINIAPRIGFAYDPFGTGKTAIRGGFGIEHSRMTTGYISGASANYPIVVDPTIYYGTLTSFRSSSSFIFPGSMTGVDRNSPTPYVMNMSLSVQRRIAGGVVVDVGYVGSLSRHMMWSRNFGSVPMGANFQAKNIDFTNNSVLPPSFLRPYLGYTDLTIYENAGTANYHSFQVTAARRLAKGLEFNMAWTWSKAMDYNDDDYNTVAILLSPRVWNYGLAGFDRTHVAKASWIYDLPKSPWQGFVPRAIFDGWQISGIASFVSGSPTGISLTTTTGFDITGTTSLSPRVDVIANPVIPKGDRTFAVNFNTSAFALPAKGTPGNSAKTVIRGPGINNFDLALNRNFHVKEKVRIQFRWETYNTFNHTQFSGLDTTARFDPAGLQTNTRFGQFTSSRTPRIMQFSLRTSF